MTLSLSNSNINIECIAVDDQKSQYYFLLDSQKNNPDPYEFQILFADLASEVMSDEIKCELLNLPGGVLYNKMYFFQNNLFVLSSTTILQIELRKSTKKFRSKEILNLENSENIYLSKVKFVKEQNLMYLHVKKNNNKILENYLIRVNLTNPLEPEYIMHYIECDFNDFWISPNMETSIYISFMSKILTYPILEENTQNLSDSPPNNEAFKRLKESQNLDCYRPKEMFSNPTERLINSFEFSSDEQFLVIFSNDFLYKYELDCTPWERKISKNFKLATKLVFHEQLCFSNR
jgi:hypothetical protein